MLTGIPVRTIYRVLSTWKSTGEVKPAPTGKRGRPRALDFADTQVCDIIFGEVSTIPTVDFQFLIKAVTRRNNRYLEELKDVLEERCGVTVTESTIWRTLKRVGFRMKVVRSLLSFEDFWLTLLDRSQRKLLSVTTPFGQSIDSRLDDTTSQNTWCLSTKALVIEGPT